MSTITVQKLAEQIGVPLERLQAQLAEVGLNNTKSDQIISENEKRRLLQHLQTLRGNRDVSEFVLQRKQTEDVSGVKVTVRKTRKVRRKTPDELDQTRRATEDQVRAEEAERLEEERLIRETEEARIAAEEQALKQLEEEALKKAVEEKNQKDAEEKVEDDAALEAGRKKKKTKEEQEEEEQEALKQAKKNKESKRGTEKETKYSHIQPHKISLSRVDEDEDSKFVRSRRKKHKKELDFSSQHQFTKPTAKMVREVNVPESISVADLAQRMSVKSAAVVKVLFNMGVAATINQIIDQDTALLIVEEMGHTAKATKENAVEERLFESIDRSRSKTVIRPPVVTIMGHVDHGKTSLLDYIRRTHVTAGEAGGITQHIGAYHVETEKGMVTFLDTPGHAAFTAMRARGVKVTDIVVLVVAADDGVMPQTIEAIQHARAGKVPIIVAVNKVDKPSADPEKLRTELSLHDVVPEEWGGEAMFVNVSAKTGVGIEQLLSSILVQSEVLELTAEIDVPASGVVVESKLDKGRGVVATMLVKNGNLKQGDIVLAGQQYGKIRLMMDENGHKVGEALPSIPVEILGLSGAPNAGDEFLVVPDERSAREVASFRQGQFKDVQLSRQKKATLDNMFSRVGEAEMRSLNIVLKADVQGSVEAISDALTKLATSEVVVKIVYSGVGGITESDVNLALASEAIMIGFNVRADNVARQLIERERVDLHYYSIIYEAIDAVKAAVLGLTKPTFEEKIVGLAQVREVFRSSKFGAIAGCMVIDGTIKRNNPIRVLRSNVVVFEGALESLRRFKDDASEVRHGMECGIGVKNYNDIKPGDQIEVYETVEIKPGSK